MKIIKIVADENRKVGLLKFKNRDAFLSSWWGDMMTFAEAKKGILVNLDFEKFLKDEGYTRNDVSFTEIKE